MEYTDILNERKSIRAYDASKKVTAEQVKDQMIIQTKFTTIHMKHKIITLNLQISVGKCLEPLILVE